EEVVAQKRRIMEMLFANETASLARRLVDILHNDLAIESVTEDAVASLLMDVTSELPVYRTYADSNGMTAHDKRLVERAADAVARRISQPDSSLLPGLRQALTLEYPAGLSSDRHAFWLHTVMRWQQLSGPATAKGLEDTSFYRFNRLISLNEVGGHAEGVELKDAHRFLHSRAERWPHAMSASSTHDTKRSEDARARIHALTWMADDWVDVVQQWMEWNRPLKRDVRGQIFPDANMEWMLYQTLAGVWPLRGEQAPDLHPRLQGFLTKAAREAKEHTSWLDVNGEYEDALLGFTAALLDPSRSGRFLDNLQRIVDRIAPLGAVLSLSQLAVKATAPGVPDFYQGQELWDFSMADPDNRRSVDYAARQSALDALAGANDADVEAIVAAWPDGRIKLYATQQLLALRRQHSDLFQAGRYVPLEVGPSLFAFARRDRDEWVLTVTPRSMRPAPSTPSKGGLPLGRSLGGGEVIRLPGGAPSRWRNVLTGQAHAARNGRLSAGALLQRFPVAVLTPA
ncbi:MAG: malto-oligosyltrehalose synthase, partial [Dehalococcoidia bacterium]